VGQYALGGIVDNADCTSPDVCDPDTDTCVGCVEDTDCEGEARCDVEANTCVGCIEDTDCDGALVCDGTSGTCVECNPALDGQCVDDPDGNLCRPNGECGCSDDSDCGGSASGRICDSDTRACIDGCRGSSGNGCPDGNECTSQTTAAGSCEPEEPGDAGVGPTMPDPRFDGVVEGGGCGCSVPGESENPNRAWLIAALVGLWGMRRRRQVTVSERRVS
jgi:MYXO-CTERM domain-containing protein